tara:strand:- start:13561 stop:14298 length:738 start_codon:yes stop_codon:yes gene_type:complete
MAETTLGLILLSGGMDSTTAAAWALNGGMKVSAISFNYGQAHRRELKSAREVARRLGLKHNVVDVSFYRELAAYSSLTSPEAMALPTGRDTTDMPKDIPSTYVPMRNTFFMTMAAAWLESEALSTIENDGILPDELSATLIIAANAIDYSGYPDCRPEFYNAIAESLRLGSKLGTQYGVPFSIATPLLELSKAEIIKLAIDLEAPLDATWSCYDAKDTPCGICDACLLRAKGFEDVNVEDPALPK